MGIYAAFWLDSRRELRFVALDTSSSQRNNEQLNAPELPVRPAVQYQEYQTKILVITPCNDADNDQTTNDCVTDRQHKDLRSPLSSIYRILYKRTNPSRKLLIAHAFEMQCPVYAEEIYR